MPGQTEQWIYPIVRQKNWRKKAACRGENPDSYVPEKKNKRDTKHYDKTLCDSCEVKADCLDFALANRAKKGLWGGTVPKERDKMYRWYLGEREYELDLDWILFGRSHGNADISSQNNPSENPFDTLCDPVAVNDPLHLTWSTPIFIQGTLFSESDYWYIDSTNTHLIPRERIRTTKQKIAIVGYMQKSLFDL